MKQLRRSRCVKPKKNLGYLPEEVLLEILQRLPLTSLLEFQCVSKSWLSLIRNPSFKLNSSTCSCSIVRYFCVSEDENDPEKFYLLKFERFAPVYGDYDLYLITNQLHKFNSYQGVGYSNGLICYLNISSDRDYYDNLQALKCNENVAGPPIYGWDIHLWNPGINRYKKVSLPFPSTDHCASQFDYRLHKFGFGFCGIKGFNDYKVVDIYFHYNLSPASCSHTSSNCHCPGHVNVYSLVSDSWKSLPSNSINVPSHLATYTKCGAYRWGSYAIVGGVYYWLVNCHDHDDSYSLVAFDLVNETFLDDKLAKLPKIFRPSCVHRLYLFELGESVALYEALDEFRTGCLWVSTTESSIYPRNSGKLTWVELFSVMVDDAKDLLVDERLPYSLQMMLKYDENIEKLDERTFWYDGVPYYAHETVYDGTYVKSLALLGTTRKSFDFIMDVEMPAEYYDDIYSYTNEEV